jgi:hypothetical protein
LCIQYEFDLKTLKFTEFKLTSANVPDGAESSLAQEGIGKNELLVKDLGYFNMQYFNKIDKADAYYVSRLSPSVLVYENGEELCLKALYEQMVRSCTLLVEKEVVLGKKKELKTRLVIELVSEECYKSRIASLVKDAKRKGRDITDQTRFRARFSFIITNIPADKMPASKLYSLYRLRWQVELMFKHWKSKLGIGQVHKMKYERLLCLLYGKLLYFMLAMEAVSIARHEQYLRCSKILSIGKCLKTILRDKLPLLSVRLSGTAELNEKIKGMLEVLSTKHWQEKRKNRENFEDIFDLFHCISDI